MPGRRCSDTDFLDCPEMGALFGLAIVFFDHVALKFPCSGDEIVRKGKPRSLAGQGKGKVPSLIVGLATRNAIQRRNQGFFNGHGAIKISNKLLTGNGRDICIGRALKTADFFHRLFIHFD